MAKIDDVGILLRVNCVIQRRKCYNKLVHFLAQVESRLVVFRWRSIYYSTLHETKELLWPFIFKGLRNSGKNVLVSFSMKQRTCELISTQLSLGVLQGFVGDVKPRPH